MKSKLLLGLVFFVFVFPSSSMAESKENFIELGMLDESLVDSEGTAVDAFAHEENRISFDQPGVPKYDSFFKEVAVISGTVAETRFVLDQFNAGTLGEADAMPVITFSLNALPELEDKIPSLIEKAEAFDPMSDFPGFRNKMKIPGVVAGLADAGTALKESATDIPGILQELTALAGPGAP